MQQKIFYKLTEHIVFIIKFFALHCSCFQIQSKACLTIEPVEPIFCTSNKNKLMKNLIAMPLSSRLLSTPLLAVSTNTLTGQADTSVYWQGGGFLRDSDGDCIRPSDWHTDTQIKGCDPIKEKPVPTPIFAIFIDTDKDGIADARDPCANTPSGIRVDGTGCEQDSDSDTITDSRDQCAGTPVGAKVDLNGCIVELMEPINYDLRVEASIKVIVAKS